MITNDIKYIGVNDHNIDLFEGQYDVPNGMSYNSYAILDEKIAIMDTVDAAFTHEWLDNIANTLGGRKPDYLVVQHMEPDHSANILNFTKAYPEAKIVSSTKAFAMMKNFFGTDFADKQVVVGEGDTLNLVVIYNRWEVLGECLTLRCCLVGKLLEHSGDNKLILCVLINLATLLNNADIVINILHWSYAEGHGRACHIINLHIEGLAWRYGLGRRLVVWRTRNDKHCRHNNPQLCKYIIHNKLIY